MRQIRQAHSIICPLRSRWLRWRNHQPFWRDDKTARMLGVAEFGCRRCGRGVVEERDAVTADTEESDRG